VRMTQNSQSGRQKPPQRAAECRTRRPVNVPGFLEIIRTNNSRCDIISIVYEKLLGPKPLRTRATRLSERRHLPKPCIYKKARSTKPGPGLAERPENTSGGSLK